MAAEIISEEELEHRMARKARWRYQEALAMWFAYSRDVVAAQHNEARALEEYEGACAETRRKRELMGLARQAAALVMPSEADLAAVEANLEAARLRGDYHDPSKDEPF